jgi:hypothetical protein
MRRILSAMIIVWIIGFSYPRTASAQDSGFKILFKDVIYGGLAGAVVGGAILAFVDDPEDHLDYIAKGAAVGVIAGAVFGLYDASTSVAELEDGTLYVGLPVPEIRVDRESRGRNTISVGARLFKWRY